VALLLEHLGHQVRIACDARAALVVADSFQPDVVLLDPTMEGITVAEVESASCDAQGNGRVRTADTSLFVLTNRTWVYWPSDRLATEGCPHAANKVRLTSRRAARCMGQTQAGCRTAL